TLSTHDPVPQHSPPPLLLKWMAGRDRIGADLASQWGDWKTTLIITGEAIVQRKVGVQFLSYVNHEGRLADGTCCDGRTLGNGACEPDQCDTAFSLCFRHHSAGSNCTVTSDTTSVDNNNTVTSFGKKIGSGENDTFSLIALPFSFMEDIVLEVDVLEIDPGVRHLLGNFSLRIDWTDLFTSTPDWHQFHFNNSVISLAVNVTSYCSKYFYGADCSTFCRAKDASTGHYTCENTGAKQCLPGQLCEVKDPVTTTKATSITSSTTTTATATTPATTTTTSKPTTPTPATTPRPAATPAPTPPSSTPYNNNNTTAAQMLNADSDSSGMNIGVVLGPLAALILLGAGSTLAFVLYRRKKRETVAPEKRENPDENKASEETKEPPKDDQQ
ncbi:hypothetical protein BaRGS_00001249, partial [Batillaria attramentaria]